MREGREEAPSHEIEAAGDNVIETLVARGQRERTKGASTRNSGDGVSRRGMRRNGVSNAASQAIES